MTRITKDPDIRRQEILDTAVRLFCEKGYEKTAISDIARAMGVAQGLCYRYFPSKEALYEAAADHYAERQAAPLIAVLRGPGSLREKLCAPYFPAEREPDDDYYRMTHNAHARSIHDRLSLLICEKLAPYAAGAIQQANETGETCIASPEDTAAFCVYGQLGILLRHDLTPEEKQARIQAALLRLCGLA